MMRKSLAAAVLTAAALAPAAHAEPWRLNDALGLPAELSLSGTTRVRYEDLGDQFRPNGTGGDQALVTRTLLRADMMFDGLSLTFEAEDSRAYFNDAGSVTNTGGNNTTIVNPLELLQAYVAFAIPDMFVDGSRWDFKVGRLTMDVGSRRFVARNRYRNTINGFTGMDSTFTLPSGHAIRAFYTLPVNRRVENYFDNEARIDKEGSHQQFWGLHHELASLPWSTREDDHAEVYFFGLNEQDTPELASRDRNIYTPGFRLWRTPSAGTIDYTWESVVQFGQSRLGTAQDLDHFAHFHHLEVGYSYDAPWKPRIVGQFDYASGDDDGGAADGKSQRFDTLFGGRRFDFGPTGIVGFAARSNLISPGLRIIVKPGARWNAFTSIRGFWLADQNDAWAASRGVQDATGNSGSYLGTQIEARVQYDAIPGNVKLEAGLAHVFDGEFMKNAPNSPNNGDVNYGYTQVVFSY